MKSILIEEELHDKLKEASKKTGIKMKSLTQTAIKYYLSMINIENKDDDKIILPKAREE